MHPTSSTTRTRTKGSSAESDRTGGYSAAGRSATGTRDPTTRHYFFTASSEMLFTPHFLTASWACADTKW
jgi:hypothetical protein